MFQHPAYTAAGSGGAHAMPGVSEMIRNAGINYKNELVPVLFACYLQLVLPVCAVCAALVRTHKRGKSLAGRLLFLYFVLFGAYGAARLISLNALWRIQLVRTMEGLMVAGFFAAIAVCAVWFIDSKACRERVMACWTALAALNAPLMLANPIGERCFLISYILLLLMGLALFGYARETGMFAGAYEKARPALLAASACMLAVLFTVYGVTFMNYRERERVMRHHLELGSGTIPVRTLMFSEYVWTGNPTNDYFKKIYKWYHELPEEVELVFYP
jgi:cytochrome bd-type quinol oxidase subunit 2